MGKPIMNLLHLLTLKAQYSDLPFEAILKTILLKDGVAFTEEALIFCKEKKIKSKSYFIFSFDHEKQTSLSDLEKFAVPEEIAILDGSFHLQRTIVSVRIDKKSAFKVDVCDNALALMLDCETLCRVETQTNPAYYEKKLKDGKPVSDITPTIEWGYLIYLTVFRLCQYWGQSEECQFCDINENFRQQKKERSYTGIKSTNDILESLQFIVDHDTDQSAKAYTVTGGSILNHLNEMNEAEFYAQYARAIEARYPNKWIGKVVTQALPLDEIKTLKMAGYQIYHPNYEIWDKNLFQKICPGKERHVGYDEWIKRIIDASEIFGPENVIPNFVAGVEMARPYGFCNIDDAIHSTTEGLNFFMSHGICPRFTLWCPEPLSVLGKQNEAPPLEYFLKLLRSYRDTHQRHKLPIPKGYGPAGVGKAVFSVSAFMDVLLPTDV